jgi:hypothetical protein
MAALMSQIYFHLEENQIESDAAGAESSGTRATWSMNGQNVIHLKYS